MKQLTIILILIFSIQGLKAQDKKITQLPADTVVQATDLFYVIDQGNTSKKMTAATLLGATGDSLNILRNQIDTAKTNLRTEIGGGGIWERSGNYVRPISNGDSLSIGMTANPSYRLDVFGRARATTALITPLILLGQNEGANAYIYEQDGELWFWSFITGGQSLAGLANFEPVGTTYTTLSPTSNWNFGGSTASTQKMTITGDIKVTQKSYLADDILFAGASGTFGTGKPSVRTSGDTLQLEDYSGLYNLEDLIGGNVAGDLDSVNFSGTNAYITKNTTSGIKLSPNGGDAINFTTNSAPYGRTISNLESLVFTSGEYLRGFRNDTTPADADSAYTWSISSVRDYVAEHGGGAGTITGTMSAGKVPYGASSSGLLTATGFKYDSVAGNLTVEDGFYTRGLQSYIDPETANGESAIANKFGTSTNYSSNARILQVKNNTTEKFYVKNDTTVATNNLKYRGDLYSWKYRTLTDTFGLVMYPGGKVDTASLVIAAEGWNAKLKPFDKFYYESKRLKALPLPYPDGTERRQLNPVYRDYQIEFELERLNRYLKRNFDGDLVQYLVIVLLIVGFGYQQVQIRKLRRK